MPSVGEARKESYKKRKTGFEKLQTRGTSNLTIQTKYSDHNTQGS